MMIIIIKKKAVIKDFQIICLNLLKRLFHSLYLILGELHLRVSNYRSI
jgi:hypothetical protein